MKIRHEVYISNENDAFTNSRLALKSLLESESQKIGDLKSDLVLENFQNLVKFPQYIVSVSHTKGAGAAILADRSDTRSLGIDIEWSDRPMKQEAERFFRHPEDSHCIDLLKLWTQKEAAFKALSPLGFPGVLVLSKIVVKKGKFFTKERPDIIGELEFFEMRFDKKLLYLSTARVP